MQLRCNVCSTVFTIGNDVARGLADEGGSVPCRNCQAGVNIPPSKKGLFGPSLPQNPRPIPTSRATPVQDKATDTPAIVAAEPRPKPKERVVTRPLGLANSVRPGTPAPAPRSMIPGALPGQRPASLVPPAAARPKIAAPPVPPTVPAPGPTPKATRTEPRPKPPKPPKPPPIVAKAGPQPDPRTPHPPLATASSEGEGEGDRRRKPPPPHPVEIEPEPNIPAALPWPSPASDDEDRPTERALPIAAVVALDPPTADAARPEAATLEATTLAVEPVETPRVPLPAPRLQAPSGPHVDPPPKTAPWLTRKSLAAAGLVAVVSISGASYWGTLRARSKEAASAPPSDPALSVDAPHGSPPLMAPATTEGARLPAEPSQTPPPSTETPPPTTAPAHRELDSPAEATPTPGAETARPAKTEAPAAPRPTASAVRAPSRGESDLETEDPNQPPSAPRSTVDHAALQQALVEAEGRAQSCTSSSSPTGVARVSVTFATTGEAVGAIVSGAPFANTLEGGCIAAKFKALRVPPFTGSEVIVRKSVTIK